MHGSLLYPPEPFGRRIKRRCKQLKMIVDHVFGDEILMMTLKAVLKHVFSSLKPAK